MLRSYKVASASNEDCFNCPSWKMHQSNWLQNLPNPVSSHRKGTVSDQVAEGQAWLSKGHHLGIFMQAKKTLIAVMFVELSI